MIKRSHLFIFVAVAILLGVLISVLLPPYILNIIEHPDGSYISAFLLKHKLKNPMLHTTEFYVSYVPAVARRFIGLTTLCAVMVALILTRWRKDLDAFLNYTSTAFNLGALRIVIVSQAVASMYVPIYSLPEMRPEAMNVIPGYGWMRELMPPSMDTVNTIMLLYKILWILALIGLFTPVSMVLLVIVGFFVQLGPHFVGKINHYHHLWMGFAILAMSPCGEALSVDWLIKKWRGVQQPLHVASRKYGRAFVLLWSMMGVVYFFPGFWKFVVGGWDWAFSENVQLKILTKIIETGQEPAIPLYNYPLLCHLGGLSTIIFEIGFPFAMIFPRTRILYALGGIGFHETNGLVMQIRFDSMEHFYLSFVNWSKILRKWTLGTSSAIAAWKGYVGSVLIGGFVVAGFLNLDSWPWAVYPTFAAIEQKFVNSIEMRIEVPGSEAKKVLFQTDPTLIEEYKDRGRLRAHINQVLVELDEAERTRMLVAMLDTWKVKNPVPKGVKVEFWHVMIPLIPMGAPAEPYKKIGVFP